MSGGSSTDSLDPRTFTDWVPGFTGYALFNLLVEIADDGRATPELAERWEARPGAVEWASPSARVSPSTTARRSMRATSSTP